MNPQTFIAESVAEAVDQIRGQLGPQALVLNVRRLPPAGLSRLWRKPRIEVTARAPAPTADEAPVTDALAALRSEVQALKQHLTVRQPTVTPPGSGGGDATVGESDEAPASTEWCGSNGRHGPVLEAWLRRGGLLPVYAQRLLGQIVSQIPDGERGAGDPAGELTLARDVLASWWRAAPPLRSNRHVFIGPSGTGKTTALCKWLAQAVMMEGRRARVWRLDSEVANTAENLSVFAEILGVPLERILPEEPTSDPTELMFIDLPGVDWRSAPALSALAARLEQLGTTQVHVVLNVAYETSILLAQARAFAEVAPGADLVLTHLDEETRWGKLWNLVLGTNYSVRFLSAGQNLPGSFEPAVPGKLLKCDLF